jgi:ribosome-binding factor A
MTHNRPARVAELVHAELSRILRQHVSDPRLAEISLTGVEMSPDLRVARVHFLPLGGRGDPQEVTRGLVAAKGYLRRHLGQVLDLRVVPDLVFLLDDGLDEAVRLTHLLHEMETARGTEPEGTEE